MKRLTLVFALATLLQVHAYNFTAYPPDNTVGPTPKQAWIDRYLSVTNIPVLPLNTVPIPHPNWTQDITTCLHPRVWGVTYDDGPSAFTPAVLDALEKADVKVTFFIIGSRLTFDDILGEILWAGKAIQEVIGVFPKYFRPPYGDIDDRVRAVIHSVGLNIVEWNEDSSDYLLSQYSNNFTQAQVVQEFKAWIASPPDNSTGIISLEHDLFANSSAAAPEALKLVLNAGYKVKPVAPCSGDESGEWYIRFNDTEANIGYGQITADQKAQDGRERATQEVEVKNRETTQIAAAVTTSVSSMDEVSKAVQTAPTATVAITIAEKKHETVSKKTKKNPDTSGGIVSRGMESLFGFIFLVL
ncbi:chitin deacetylase [Physocladia obscura]|uniref:Chitin deacetylase n=1 Tax=Physocladia obscura TaxID=109957 RepID=A0AAD5XAE1_9FUNG|nr:chitin deacetylase [Physocladia obscura]